MACQDGDHCAYRTCASENARCHSAAENMPWQTMHAHKVLTRRDPPFDSFRWHQHLLSTKYHAMILTKKDLAPADRSDAQARAKEYQAPDALHLPIRPASWFASLLPLPVPSRVSSHVSLQTKKAVWDWRHVADLPSPSLRLQLTRAAEPGGCTARLSMRPCAVS